MPNPTRPVQLESTSSALLLPPCHSAPACPHPNRHAPSHAPCPTPPLTTPPLPAQHPCLPHLLPPCPTPPRPTQLPCPLTLHTETPSHLAPPHPSLPVLPPTPPRPAAPPTHVADGDAVSPGADVRLGAVARPEHVAAEAVGAQHDLGVARPGRWVPACERNRKQRESRVQGSFPGNIGPVPVYGRLVAL